MMFAGIGGMVGAIVAQILMGDAVAHWMLFGRWGVVAICGAIGRGKRGD